ncbi:hypothetical protein AVEN_19218-1 [Araneus ventricosus]|uniref:Uncharacterized protein n=1 Tax=Araneus ventricosus TaxID=182803 RepID=A0A4Y2GS52_ARAVE|nr:hypothetical protein AVEN_19218-1 [Araneus ventricosus]
MTKCHENVKAVQRAWKEEFRKKNWPHERTIRMVQDDEKAMATATASVTTDEAKERVDDFLLLIIYTHRSLTRHTPIQLPALMIMYTKFGLNCSKLAPSIRLFFKLCPLGQPLFSVHQGNVHRRWFMYSGLEPITL